MNERPHLSPYPEESHTMMNRLLVQQETEDLSQDPEETHGLTEVGQQAILISAIDRHQKSLEADNFPEALQAEDVVFDYEDKSPGFEARLKNIEGKLPMSLLSPIYIEGTVRVLAKGSIKYGPNMWREDPMPHTEEINSIIRHLQKFLLGEDIDPAGGELHLFNASCRLSFLSERYYTRPDLDDRYKPFGQIGPHDLNRYAHLQGGCIPEYTEDIEFNDEGLEEADKCCGNC